jgi:hypothetical protein
MAEIAQDEGQFLPNGVMPSSGPATALAVDKLAGNITKPVNIAPHIHETRSRSDRTSSRHSAN